jgi:prepilin-type N-terminal cleavage/methylation domain-containing protein
MLVTVRRQSGLSLIELMVALVLLTVGLLGLAVAFPPGRRAIEGGNQLTTATFLARQVVEQMRNRTYDSDTDEITTGNYPSLAYGTIAGFPSYRRTVTISDNTPMAETKTVTVTIFYRDDTGVERSTSLTTIFARST